MALAIIGMRVVEVLFFVGIVGSAVVIVISSIEDMHELFGKTEHAVTTIDETQGSAGTQ
jgi:hypothetical protein